MGRVETSGVGARGLGAHQQRATTPPASDGFAANARLGHSLVLSPITAAVALTAVFAALLFVAYDTVCTFAAAQHELPSNAAWTADNSGTDGTAAASAIPPMSRQFDLLRRASLITAPPADSLAAFPSHFLPATNPGPRAEGAAAPNQWAAIGQRAGIAFGLAGLLTVLVWRRRRGDMPDLLQRHSYRILAAAIPMGVACWTRDGVLVTCNEQYRARLDLCGKTVTYHDAVKRMIAGGYVKMLNDDANNRLLELHARDGSCLLIDERPLADGGFMTLVSDVTERKKTDTMLQTIREEQRQLARRYHEEKLNAEAANRAKTNFLAHLSHDIRTPLNHIIGFADLMRHQAYGPLGDARYADYVQSIKSSGEHLLASFATILDLAELEGGRKALRHDPLQVDDVLESVLTRFAGTAARAKVGLELTRTCGATIEGDRLGLVRMVSNIVENSLRFTPAGGRITLSAFAADDGVVLEITDTGIGMSQERLASLSQPFALGDATFTREGAGPGLGLSIAQAIAEQSGGSLAIDSSPALGTTVAISLPLLTADLSVAA